LAPRTDRRFTGMQALALRLLKSAHVMAEPPYRGALTGPHALTGPPFHAVPIKSDPRHPADESPAGSQALGHALTLMVGARFTTVVHSSGGRTTASRIISHGPVLLAAAQAEAASANGAAAARVIRAAAAQVVERARLELLRGDRPSVFGATGIAQAVITLGSAGLSKATLAQVQAASDRLAAIWVDGRSERRSRVEPMLIGAAMLTAILGHLGASEIEVEAELSDHATLKVG
jgi:hypothetical protein